MAADDDFVLTILSEDEFSAESSDEAIEVDAELASQSKKRKRSGNDAAKKHKKRKAENSRYKGESEEEIASDFEFELGGPVLDEFDGWGNTESITQLVDVPADKKGVDIYQLISQRSHKIDETINGADQGISEDGNEESADAPDLEDDELLAEDGFGMGADAQDSAEESVMPDDEEDEEENDEQGESHEESNSQDDLLTSTSVHPMDLAPQDSDDDKEDPREAKRRAAFFAPEEQNGNANSSGKGQTLRSFLDMGLSRPILKGLSAVGFNEPTPIQRQAIPVALAGKDVVGGAVTGSGKTAAFLVPILERLVFRPKKVPTTRVAILMPTRELAVQCYNVATKIASYTDITFAQIVGGYSVREQEQTLKKRPDVIIATPGRFIDHMRNSSGFAIETLEILVLDEADRMLEDGFADELNEILKTIPKSRQTMLFSATMTEDVDKLIRAGLRRPVRLLVDAKKQTVSGLVQEFIRLRPGREDKRLSYLMWLCENIYTERVIIFFRQKKEVHKILVTFALCGLQAAELHGAMTQEQRIQAVEAFRSGKATFLLSTDLASRGLDIKNVNAVINYEAPQSHEIYLHRVGRTARAGRSGRACTLAAESDRKVVKEAVKTARRQGAKIASRTVPPEAAEAWASKIEGMAEEIDAVFKEEKELKVLNIAERDIRKGENMIIHEDEIRSRPKRTWFENEKQKKESKDKGRVELNGSESIAVKGTKKKLSNKQKKRLDLKTERREAQPFKKTKATRGKNISQLKASSKVKGAKKRKS